MRQLKYQRQKIRVEGREYKRTFSQQVTLKNFHGPVGENFGVEDQAGKKDLLFNFGQKDQPNQKVRGKNKQQRMGGDPSNQ